jgi:asparagine synthase (glutamine-hydrolysing)
MMNQYISRVVDLSDPSKNIIYNKTLNEARELLLKGHSEDIRKIDGQFALVAHEGRTVKMARSIGRPLRYFIAKLIDGPCLIIAERIDEIYNYLKDNNLHHQFHPSYTRMIPAHYVTSIELLGCPDPNPVYERFFTPERNKLQNTNIDEIGKLYIGTLYNEIVKWLKFRAKAGPVGVSFSAGIDSGSVFLLTYYALTQLGESPSRLKAFTLSVEGGGEDILQARKFLDSLGLGLFLEEIEVPETSLDWRKAVKVTEDYKPLDIQAATMNLALLQAIRNRYPEWKYIIDGDGGDENLKDYAIEENPELTIKSVLNNMMLYQEGWGVYSMKHSMTYSGGQSRGITRTSAPAQTLEFESFSPYTLPNVIEIAEGIPFIELTGWDHHKLYELKGQIVAAGVKAVTGLDMPVFTKRRFQVGAADSEHFNLAFPEKELDYRKQFHMWYE